MTRIASLAGLAALALAAGTAMAAAAPNAIATDDFDLRKAPKNSSARVNLVEEGDPLTITQCQGKWCYAKVPGPDGWIRIEFLAPLDRYGEVYLDAPFSLDFDPDDDGYGRRGGRGGRNGGRDGGGRDGGRDGGGFTIGGDDGFDGNDGGGRGGRGGRDNGDRDGGRGGKGGQDGGGRGGKGGQDGGGKGGRDAQACFYADVGYAGASFCVPAGNSIPNVGPDWNDRISSVRVTGGASAQVCADEYFGGACTTWNQDIPNVGWQWNDTVTSLAVR